jgi:hypothetical protein
MIYIRDSFSYQEHLGHVHVLGQVRRVTQRITEHPAQLLINSQHSKEAKNYA